MSNESNTNVSAQTVLSLGVSIEKMGELRTSFFAERQTVQDAVSASAKVNKRDNLVEYADYLFNMQLKDKYEYAQKKIERVKLQAVVVLIGAGKTEAEARTMLGLGPKS